jgi:DNA modification methylase
MTIELEQTNEQPEQLDYQEFLAQKGVRVQHAGIDISPEEVNDSLYEFQRDIVLWACRLGRAAIFANTGMGKTFMYIEYARLMGQTTLIVAPLSVAYQTIREGKKLGVEIIYVKNDLCIQPGKIYITNYERIDKFRAELFGTVILDESSRLKNFTGKQRNQLVRQFRDVPYRLCATATPAPNDMDELGNHAEFLGYMKMTHMTATFFVYDAMSVKKGMRAGYRLKGHAKEGFFRWLASWSVALNYPSDLGYSDDGFVLPPLTVTHHTIDYDFTPSGMLPGFGSTRISATEARKIRRETIGHRNDLITSWINDSQDQWIVWCGLNDEAIELQRLIPDSINVHGGMSPEDKAKAVLAFQNEEIRVLITKIKIAGMGMNLQNSHRMVFNGLDYSWEGYYQAIRRQWRHRQEFPVDVRIVTSKHETTIYNVVMAKEKEAIAMTKNLIKATHIYSEQEIRQLYRGESEYSTDVEYGDKWQLILGDSVEEMRHLESDSVDLSVYSPPFGIEVFVYSNSERDLSNANNADDFWNHYGFIIRENLRIQKPGTVCAVHVTDGRILKQNHGYVGIKDFSGDVIEQYINHGWEYVGRVTIWKNPQAQAIRLKMQTLQFTQMRKDSRKLRPAMPDYLLLFKKPGECETPANSYERGEINEDLWIQWASPIWLDIDETDVLNARVARNDKDEKHMCPLQLPLIERCVKLWSNPDELVFSPFAGIGSEGYEALRWGRRFLGIELKPEYWKVACHNLNNAEQLNGQTLFDWAHNNNGSNGNG